MNLFDAVAHREIELWASPSGIRPGAVQLAVFALHSEAPEVGGEPQVIGCGPALQARSSAAFVWDCEPSSGHSVAEVAVPMKCFDAGQPRIVTLRGEVSLSGASSRVRARMHVEGFTPRPWPQQVPASLLRRALFAAVCVPHGGAMDQPWELMVLARHDGQHWTALAAETAGVPDAPPPLEPENPLAVLPALGKKLQGHRWFEVNTTFGARPAPPGVGQAPHPVSLDNFSQEVFHGLSLGPCPGPDSFDSVFLSEQPEPVTPTPAVARRMLAAVRDLGGAYAHFWFRVPSVPGLLLAGGNTSAMFPPNTGERNAFAGEWFGQIADDPHQEPDWLSLRLRTY